MIALSLRDLARALGGEVSGGEVLAPGPGHSRKDRSLAVKSAPAAPDGFVCFSHANDDWQVCRDYVRAHLGLNPNYRAPRRDVTYATPPKRRCVLRDEDEASREREKARWLWRQRRPIDGKLGRSLSDPIRL
jgi:hypothetical protein